MAIEEEQARLGQTLGQKTVCTNGTETPTRLMTREYVMPSMTETVKTNFCNANEPRKKHLGMMMMMMLRIAKTKKPPAPNANPKALSAMVSW